jgi:hypothetical protein
VVEVVQVALGHVNPLTRWHLQTGEEVRGWHIDVRGRDPHGIGRAGVNNETLGPIGLRCGETTVDSDGVVVESNHPQVAKSEDELEVVARRVHEAHRWCLDLLFRRPEKSWVWVSVSGRQIRRQNVKQLAAPGLGGESNAVR